MLLELCIADLQRLWKLYLLLLMVWEMVISLAIAIYNLSTISYNFTATTYYLLLATLYYYCIVHV